MQYERRECTIIILVQEQKKEQSTSESKQRLDVTFPLISMFLKKKQKAAKFLEGRLAITKNTY